MEQFGEIQIPEIEEKKRWSRKRKIAAGIFVGCIIMSIIAVFVFFRLYFTEERAFLRAFRKLAEEMRERQELWEEATGNGPEDSLDQIRLTTICNLSGEELPFTLGVDTILIRDADAREMRSETKFSVMNNQLAELEIYGEDNTLIVTLPDFFEQNFIFDAERIDLQYNESLFAEIFGVLEDCEISVNLFRDKEPIQWMKYLADWQEEIDLEKLENLIDISVPEKDDRKYRCSQYRLTIPKDWINRLMTDCMEISGNWAAEKGMTVESTQDLVIVIAIEEKTDRIVRILMEEPIALSFGNAENKIEMEAGGSICFLGEGRSIDDIVVSMQAEMPFEINERLKAVFGYDTEDKIEIQMSAEALYHENDTSVTADLHKLTVSVDRIGEFKLTGEAVLEPLREEIETPTGENIRLFEMTEEEYRDLKEQLLKKIWRWMKAYSIFG